MSSSNSKPNTNNSSHSNGIQRGGYDSGHSGPTYRDRNPPRREPRYNVKDSKVGAHSSTNNSFITTPPSSLTPTVITIFNSSTIPNTTSTILSPRHSATTTSTTSSSTGGITSTTTTTTANNNSRQRNVTDILKNALVPPVPTPVMNPETGVKMRSRELEIYGVILSIRNSFGFLQAITEDEQYYFPDREFYDNIKGGDRVAFIPRTSSKGPSAHNVRYLIPSLSKLQYNVYGLIKRIPEKHRSGFGLIEIDLNTIINNDIKKLFETKFQKILPYRPVDIVNSTFPKGHFLVAGDSIECTISKMHDSNLHVGTEIKFKQLRRDRHAAIEIQRMLEAGAIREIGIVTTIKNQEYGFIRAQDRKDELYFRIDDIVDEDIDIKEGSEVDFFVIAEIIKGKLSDRAFHLKSIPKGTVQYEVVVVEESLVTVIDEPGVGANETPGTAIISSPIDVAETTRKENNVIKEVDIWQRCLPEDMICKKGDQLLINVHYYRPEKLFFARSAKVGKYLPLGRDTGVICAVKEQAFGFIKSDTRKADLYFRSNQVVGKDGTMLSQSDITSGMRVSYDISIEEGTGKLRALRVRVELDEDIDAEYTLRKNLIGTVVRNAVKKDTVGLIQIDATQWKDIHDIDFVDPKSANELKFFINNSHLLSFEVQGLTTNLLKSYTELLGGMQYSSILKFEVNNAPGIDNFRNLKVWKEVSLVLPPLPPLPSSFESTSSPFSSSMVLEGEINFNKDVDALVSDAAVSDVAIEARKFDEVKSKDGYTVPFVRDDCKSSEFGPINNDLEVIFDVHWDRMKDKKVAKNIRLTDESIANETDRFFGTIDLVVDKGEKFGCIRVIDTEEKLFWFTGSVRNIPLSELQMGKYVSFQIRRRGGLRCAADICSAIQVIDPVVREELCTALIISATHAILLDTSSCPPIQKLYTNPKVLHELIIPAAKEGQQWEKKSIKGNSSQGAEGVVINTDQISNEDEVSWNPSLSLAHGKVLEDSSSISNRVEYKAKYFSTICRTSIPIGNVESSVKVEVGNIVVCKVALSYKQRVPVHIEVVEILPEKGWKKKGTVSKTRFRPKTIPKQSAIVSSEELSRYGLSNTDYIEILDVESKTKSETTLNKCEVLYFYCDVQEIPQPLNEYSRDILVQSDEVEFWYVESVGHVALAPTLVPKAQLKGEEGLKFHGLGFNEQLKEFKSKIGVVNNIVMAKGPPTDTALGFLAGWRQLDETSIAELPWASLLTHLVSK